MGLNVHLVDGTYELFRYHYSPANKDPDRGAHARRGGVLPDAARAGRHPCRGGDGPRHRVLPQRPLGRVQGRVRRGPPAEGAVPGGRGRAASRRVHGVGHGRAGGGRRAGRGRGRGCGRRAGRAGRDLHAGQGPRPVRRRQGVAVGPPAGQVVRRRRRARAPRRATGVHPGPPRARRRRRRRLPRSARLGREVGGRHPRPVGPPRADPRGPAPPGMPASGAPPSSTPRCATSSRWRCCSAGSQRWRRTRRSAWWTTGGGQDRPLGSPTWLRPSTRRSSPCGRRSWSIASPE